MCFKTKKPDIPPPQPAPAADEQGAAVADERRRVRTQRSTYGNVFTSALGDVNYGANVAKLGA